MFDRDFLLTVASRIGSVLLMLGAVVLTARSLGPEGQGEYVLGITFCGLVVQFAVLGLHSSNTYFVAQNPSALKSLVANSFLLSVVMGSLFAALGVLIVRGFPDIAHTGGTWFFWVCAAMVPSRLFVTLAQSLFVGLNRYRAYNISLILCNACLLLAVVVASLAKAPLYGYLFATCASWTLTAGLMLSFFVWQGDFSLRFDYGLFKSGFSYAFKAHVVCLLGFLVLRANIFLLGEMSGEAEVGHYSIAAQIADLLNLIPATQGLVLFPRLVQDAAQRWSATVRSMVQIAAFLLVACLISSTLLKPLVLLAIGEQYERSFTILHWMLPAAFFYGLTSIISQYLAAIGFPRAVVGIWIAALAILLGTGVLFISRFDGVGAALALSVVYAFVFVVELAYCGAHYRQISLPWLFREIPTAPQR